MCRNIRPLFNFEPPATEDEVREYADWLVDQSSRCEMFTIGRPMVNNDDGEPMLRTLLALSGEWEGTQRIAPFLLSDVMTIGLVTGLDNNLPDNIGGALTRKLAGWETPDDIEILRTIAETSDELTGVMRLPLGSRDDDPFGGDPFGREGGYL